MGKKEGGGCRGILQGENERGNSLKRGNGWFSSHIQKEERGGGLNRSSISRWEGGGV